MNPLPTTTLGTGALLGALRNLCREAEHLYVEMSLAHAKMMSASFFLDKWNAAARYSRLKKEYEDILHTIEMNGGCDFSKQ